MGEPLLVADLLCPAPVLAARLEAAVEDGQWLDAYLLAAGLSQLAEDRLHPDPLLLYRAASYLRGMPSRPARLAGAAAAVLGAGLRAGRGPALRRLVRARHALAALCPALADRVLGQAGDVRSELDVEPLLRAIGPALPALGGDLLRMPASFHSFDQHPDDVAWLAAAFLRRSPAGGAPLCVVGARTSGSYLAPLLAAALRARGAPRAEVLTYRPGRPFLRWERAVLRATARAGGQVLVTDDPPGTGTSLAATARAIAGAGVPDARIILLVSLFGPASGLPRKLARWQAIVQPWADWSVHRRLAAEPVSRALATLVAPGAEVKEVVPAGPLGQAGDRGHQRARFAVRLTDAGTGTMLSRDILVEGVGLGYLGRQAIAVAGALPGELPGVYGVEDGLLYRDWLPAQPGRPPGHVPAAVIAGYAAARQRALPAPGASVDRLGGRDPVWEVAARLLSGQYGPLAVPARPLLLDPLARRLLRPAHPAIVDGKTGHQHWRPDPAAAGAPRKVDFHQRSFGHLDLACYDPVFDLAGAAAVPPDPGFEAQLRAAYQEATGEEVDGERWLLYRLAQLWRLGRAGDADAGTVRARSAAAVHDYLAGRFLAGMAPAGLRGEGPLCAIDLDGVLECDRLGYAVTSPTGMRSLRALIAHGYRPVLATGRSLPAVADRCAAFGLVGGVAEYGAVIYHEGAVIDLRPGGERRLLEEIRDDLAGRPGIQVDPRYRYTVRARVARTGHGQGPVPDGLLAGIRGLGSGRVRVIQGEGQTDITVTGADKGTGLRALAARLSDPPIALAVGDSPPDLPLFACAALARAPRNARLGAHGAGIRRTRRAYQAGLAEACGDLLGHRPGGCPACRPPASAARTRAVLAILDLRANGIASLPAGTAALGVLAVRAARS